MMNESVNVIFNSCRKLKELYYYNNINTQRMDTNKEIVSRLKFIGRIQKGEKINTRHMYVQQDGLTTTISRTFINQDNRANCLSFIQDTISKAFELLSLYERSDRESDILICLNIVKDIQNAKVGINNIKETYMVDVKFTCDLDTLMEFIDARLIGLSKKYPMLKENEEKNIFTMAKEPDRKPSADAEEQNLL
jgi:hypothetical protein